jgi:hypothetical protein
MFMLSSLFVVSNKGNNKITDHKQHGLLQNPWGEPRCSRRVRSFWEDGYNTLYKAFKIKLIQDLNYYIYPINMKADTQNDI